jgi:hypothetical protein
VLLTVDRNVMYLDFGRLFDLLDEGLAVLGKLLELIHLGDVLLPPLQGLVHGMQILKIIDYSGVDALDLNLGGRFSFL